MLDERRSMDSALITPEVTERAIELQHELGRRGQHRLPIPDLVISAAAQATGLVVLHYDSDFERITAAGGAGHEWGCSERLDLNAAPPALLMDQFRSTIPMCGSAGFGAQARCSSGGHRARYAQRDDDRRPRRRSAPPSRPRPEGRIAGDHHTVVGEDSQPELVIHAMLMRDKYRRLLRGGE